MKWRRPGIASMGQSWERRKVASQTSGIVAVKIA
jgi:hypothetical protein